MKFFNRFEIKMITPVRKDLSKEKYWKKFYQIEYTWEEFDKDENFQYYCSHCKEWQSDPFCTCYAR